MSKLSTLILSQKSPLVELPKEMLMNVHSFEQQIAVNRLFFQELPTYSEIVNRTSKISLFFKVLSANTSEKDLDVTPMSGFQNLYSTKRTYKLV
jgi:hypothetical protein